VVFACACIPLFLGGSTETEGLGLTGFIAVANRSHEVLELPSGL
jgi:hypothetical protein